MGQQSAYSVVDNLQNLFHLKTAFTIKMALRYSTGLMLYWNSHGYKRVEGLS